MPTDSEPLDGDDVGILERLARRALIAEAEDLAAASATYQSPGTPETDDEMARINTFTAAAWDGSDGARTTRIRGGNDYLTVRIEGPAADTFVDQLAHLAERLNPGYWRIARSPHPF